MGGLNERRVKTLLGLNNLVADTSVDARGKEVGVDMKNAFEYVVKLNQQGRPLQKRIVVGPIVVCAIVAIIASFSGRALLHLPASLWDFSSDEHDSSPLTMAFEETDGP
jgi:hypothetical protein